MNSVRASFRALRILHTSALLGAVAFTASAEASASPFTLFESGQVRPLAISPNRKLLFATNTPDNRLEVFRIRPSGLQHLTSIAVGLEPVAVAARDNNEVWVVNHLSDSVSVVALSGGGQRGRVVRTLLVGDEPRDIVFAGPGGARAFITAAHRGQNVPFDPQLTTPGVGRADVWVFDADHLGSSLGGSPLTILSLFADTPRSLAVTPDGTRVYAAGFHSGNRTATVTEQAIPDGGEDAGGLPWPNENFEGVPQPEVGLIVKFDGAHWVDELGRAWDSAIKFSLPDKDVFAINAMGPVPTPVPGPSGTFAGVGTILFNMAVNPISGKVYVSNTEAFNEVRFEGPGIFAGSSVRGHLHESRITVLGAGGSVAPRHLNKHINYDVCCAPIPNAENAKSLAFPQSMAVTDDGTKLYVAALGSSKVGVFSTASLENNTFTPSTASQIHVTGGGPTGLVLDDHKDRLYVLTRFDNAISIIDTGARAEIAHVRMHNPEPASVVVGRRYLYDASFSSSHGDSACASCHVFGDFDSLAWDLGNPDGSVFNNPNPFFGPTVLDPVFNPMKGPMTTQSLRGMANAGPMHWRGDRTGGNDAPSAQPDDGSFDEVAAFKKFSVGFTDLLGRSAPPSAAAMKAFADFILQVTYPPNPIRALDDSLTPDQQVGRDFYFGPISQGTGNCNACHLLDRDGNSGVDAPGFFGTSGLSSFDFESFHLKVPHLRNQYQKVGMFGMPDVPIALVPGDNDFLGDQVRGFGFLHDGSFDTNFRFMRSQGFSPRPDNPDGIPAGPAGDQLRRQLESFMLAFDSNMFPIMGQQITLTSTNAPVAAPRIALLVARAEEEECDLVVKGALDGTEEGFLYVGADHFIRDRVAAPVLTGAQLRNLAAHHGQELTYTCAPPGSGARIGVDRDGDGYLDGDEEDAGSDPADPASTP